MKTNILNKLLASSMLLASSAFAIPQGPCGPCGTCGEVKEVCCEKPAPGPFAFAYPKDIGLACPNDFYVFGEFLYMQAQEDGLEYAITDSPCDTWFPGDDNLRFPVTNGDVQGFCNGTQNWHWNPGFRVGVGFYMNHDAWNIEGVWTNLNITDSASSNPTGNARMIPLWVLGDPYVYLGEVRGSARWTTDFNTLDIQIGKPHHVSRHFVLTPHFGLRFASIDQYYSTQYSSGWNDDTTNATGSSFDGSIDFYGIGSRVGIDSEWILGCNAGFYTNIAASLLYGTFNVDQTWRGGSQLNDGNNVANAMNSDLDFNVYKNVANFEMQLGVFWGMFFCDMQYHVGMRLGWEFHYWYDQNQLRNWTDNEVPIYNDTVSRGDLTLTGLSFRLQFDF